MNSTCKLILITLILGCSWPPFACQRTSALSQEDLDLTFTRHVTEPSILGQGFVSEIYQKGPEMPSQQIKYFENHMEIQKPLTLSPGCSQQTHISDNLQSKSSDHFINGSKQLPKESLAASLCTQEKSQNTINKQSQTANTATPSRLQNQEAKEGRNFNFIEESKTLQDYSTIHFTYTSAESHAEQSCSTSLVDHDKSDKSLGGKGQMDPTFCAARLNTICEEAYQQSLSKADEETKTSIQEKWDSGLTESRSNLAQYITGSNQHSLQQSRETMKTSTNQSFQVFDIRKNKLLSAILNLDNSSDTEDSMLFSLISPVYIHFTISIVLIYGFLFLIVVGALYFYRKYHSLKARYLALERMNMDLLQQNQVLTQNNLSQQNSSSNGLQSSIQRQNSAALRDLFISQQKAPYEFSSQETYEEIAFDDQLLIHKADSVCMGESEEFHSLQSEEGLPLQSIRDNDLNLVNEKMLSPTRARLLSHDNTISSRTPQSTTHQHSHFRSSIFNILGHSPQKQHNYLTPSRIQQEEGRCPSLFKSRSSQFKPQYDDQLLMESNQQIMYHDEDFRQLKAQTSPIYVEGEFSVQAPRILTEEQDFKCKRNLFQNQAYNNSKVPQLDFNKINSMYQHPINEDYNDSTNFTTQIYFPYQQRWSDDHNDNRYNTHQAPHNISMRGIQTDRSNPAKLRNQSLQKFNKYNTNGFNHFKLPESQFSRGQNYNNSAIYAQAKQKTMSQGRQMFHQAQSFNTSPFMKPQAPPAFNQQSFNIKMQGMSQYQQENPIFSPQYQTLPRQRGSFNSKNERFMPNGQEQQPQEQQSVCQEDQTRFDQQSISSAIGNRPYFGERMSQSNLDYLSVESQETNFQRQLMSPLINNQIYMHRMNDQIILRNQQSASPKIQQAEYRNFINIQDGYYDEYNSNSFDQEFDNPRLQLHKSQGLIKMNTKSAFSERCFSQEENNDQENYPCLLYLENGRYKNSFEEISFLGKGGFGICHKVRHRLDSNFYAIKKIRMHLAYDQDIKEHKVYREIMALPMLNHKNVVRYFGCWAEQIDWKEDQIIEKRVKEIQRKLKQQKKYHKRGRKLCIESSPDVLKEEESAQEQDIINVNGFDFDGELDDAFERAKTKSHLTQHESPCKKNRKIKDDQSDIQEMDEQDSNGKVDDDESYSFEESDQELEEVSENESVNEDASNSYVSESDDYDDENDDNVSEINDDLFSDEGEILQDDSNSGDMGIFDDDALIEFIRKDQKFISIDLMIQMEYCSGQSLQDQLHSEERVVDSQRNLQYFKQMLSAVKHIHQNGFIHRDLKPANIFIEGSQLKIGDFGLARKFQQSFPKFNLIEQALNSGNLKSPKGIKNMSQKGLKRLVRSISQQSLLTTQAGTSTYLSPEQEQNKPYNEKVDMFALGLILCELCCKFSTTHERLTTLNDLKNKAKLPEKILKGFPIESQIILLLINKDPEQRPSAAELLKHTLMEQWSKLFSVISPRDLLSDSNNLAIHQAASSDNLAQLHYNSLNVITEEHTVQTQSIAALTSNNLDSDSNSCQLESIESKINKIEKNKMTKVSSMLIKNTQTLQDLGLLNEENEDLGEQ